MNGTPAWQVTGQTDTQEFDPSGNVQNGKTVTFVVTATGTTHSVFVPDVIYANTEAVRELIQSQVDQITAVHRLSG